MNGRWDVEATDEFANWLLALGFPYSSGIRSSRHRRMRELRVQVRGTPYRILYAFDPRRTAILPLGGNKSGDNQWYSRNVATADALYDEHLETLRMETVIDEEDQEVE